MRIGVTGRMLAAAALVALVPPCPSFADEPEVLPPPVPASAPRVLAPPPIVTAPPRPKKSHPAAPVALEGPAPVLTKKEIKAARSERQAKTANCFIRGELKQWMAEKMLQACDELLGARAGEDDPWDWRARLLQFRAVALINLDDDKRALEALDEADAIGDAVGDPLFDLGVGIGNDLLRAYLLGRAGERDKAMDLLERVRVERPYSLSVLRAVDRFEGDVDGSDTAFVARLERRVRLDPNVTRSLMFIYLIRGELERAAGVADQVTLTEPRLRGGWTLNTDGDALDALEREAAYAGAKAYIATALGNLDRARSLIEEERADILDYIGPDLSKDPTVGKSPLKKYLARREKGDQLLGLVSDWETAARLRAEIGSHTMEQMLDTMGELQNRVELFPAMIDLLGQYAKGEDSEEAKTASELVPKLVKRMLEEDNDLKPSEIADWLPPAEYLDQVPKFASTASKWLITDGSGYSQTKEGDGAIRTVRYESQVGAPSLVEEMLLMAIANYAEKEGKDAFMILSRRTVQRTITTTGYFYNSYTRDAGFEAQARVLLVDSANPPPGVPGQETRLITVAEVHDAIVPRYAGYIDRKEAEKQAAKAAKKKK